MVQIVFYEWEYPKEELEEDRRDSLLKMAALENTKI